MNPQRLHDFGAMGTLKGFYTELQEQQAAT